MDEYATKAFVHRRFILQEFVQPTSCRRNHGYDWRSCGLFNYGLFGHHHVDNGEYPAPDAIARRRNSVAGADAHWTITPEYKACYPGQLKNVFDRLLRPVVREDYATPTVVRGKIATTHSTAKRSPPLMPKRNSQNCLAICALCNPSQYNNCSALKYCDKQAGMISPSKGYPCVMHVSQIIEPMR